MTFTIAHILLIVAIIAHTVAAAVAVVSEIISVERIVAVIGIAHASVRVSSVSALIEFAVTVVEHPALSWCCWLFEYLKCNITAVSIVVLVALAFSTILTAEGCLRDRLTRLTIVQGLVTRPIHTVPISLCKN